MIDNHKECREMLSPSTSRAHDRLRYQKHDILLGNSARECLELELRDILCLYQSLLTDAKIRQVSSTPGEHLVSSSTT